MLYKYIDLIHDKDKDCRILLSNFEKPESAFLFIEFQQNLCVFLWYIKKFKLVYTYILVQY